MNSVYKKMDNNKIGYIIIVISLLLIFSTFVIKSKEDAIINKVIHDKGSCFLDDGTCLHQDRDMTIYIVVWIFSATLLALGLYLVIFEKSQKEIISILERQKQIQTEREKFEILMKGLSIDERKVIRAIKGQDGITQQTLRLRADMHKSKLSIVLDGLEKKDLIQREAKGKTKQVFLKTGL
jgi:hypothetical protein